MDATLAAKEEKWRNALAVAKAKAEAKKKRNAKHRPGTAKVTVRTVSGDVTGLAPADSAAPAQEPPKPEPMTPFGRPWIFRCEHGVVRLHACEQCGLGRTWETHTIRYIKERRAQGFYPF